MSAEVMWDPTVSSEESQLDSEGLSKDTWSNWKYSVPGKKN